MTMNFDLPEEAAMMRDAVREFAEKEIRPIAGELDEKERRAGEIKIAEKFAERIGAKFIDARVKKVIQCKCGKVFDILAFIYEKK